MQESDDKRTRAEALLALVLDAAPRAPGAVPTLEELAAWRAGRLEPGRAREVRAHVARDPEVYRLWRELMLSEEELAPATAGADLSRRGYWRRLQDWFDHLPRAALAGAAASLFVAVLVLQVLIEPDLRSRIDGQYADWEMAPRAPSAVWPLAVSESGKKTVDLLESLRSRQRSFEARAFRAGLRGGLERVAGSEPAWTATIRDLESEPGDCPPALDAAPCRALESVAETLGRWAALVQLQCAAAEGESRAEALDLGTVEALLSAIREAGASAELQARLYEVRTALEQRNLDRACRAVTELVRFGS